MRGAVPEPLPLRLARGAIGGLVAGLIFMGATMWFSSSVGNPSDGPLMMISTILKGDGAMSAGTASAELGWIVHSVLSVGFGIAFSLLAPLFRTNGTIAIAGAAFGALLYLLNFQVISPIALPIFSMANQPFEAAIHVVFGLLLSLVFFGSGVRRGDPIVAFGRDLATSS
ncbi:MAG: hypothetical protein ACRDK3_13330 [Actinomycetota bacterium]